MTYLLGIATGILITVLTALAWFLWVTRDLDENGEHKRTAEDMKDVY